MKPTRSFQDKKSDGCWTFDVHGDDLLPLYAHGEQIVVSPSATINIGDHVSALTGTGRIVAGPLFFRSSKDVFIGLGGWSGRVEKLNVGSLKAFGRVVWASQ